MNTRWTRYVAVAAVGGALGVVPIVGAVGATDDGASTTTPTTLPAPVVAESSTFTLPLFGAPLTLDVATDPGGALASVAINPADGYTAVADRPNRVVFVNADGTATVRVNAGRRGDQVKVSGSALTDILGPGGWSGDVFGTGATTTVSFTVADRGDGTPDIVGVSSSDAAATVGATEYHSSRKGSSARASVVFDDGAQKRVLSISAMVSTRGEETTARLAMSLSNARGVPQAATDAAGVHAWDGLLCDGTAAHIEFTVAEDGTVSGISATPDGAGIDDHGWKTKVEFASDERVRISVWERDGQITVNVDPAFRCDTADPTVNTPIDTTAPDWDHHDRDGDHRGDHDGDGGRDGRGWGDGDAPGGGTPGDDGDGRGGWDDDGDRDGGGRDRGDRDGGDRDGDRDRGDRDGGDRDGGQGS